MIKTKVTETLGIETPILGGTMMWLSTPEFVAAISDAGSVGIVASAMWKSKEEFQDALKKVKDHTDKPFAVNLNLFPAMRPIDNNIYLDVLLEEGVKIIETSGHKAPEDLARRFKECDVTWIHKCVGVRYAKKAASLGADMVTVVGYENGGATGVLDIGTFVLIPRVVEELDIPVIGGGGVSDGRGLVAALALGAEGVIMGTRFLVSEECPIHDNVKKALINAQETDTVLVMRSVGNTHRLWKNERAELIIELEEKKAPLQDIIMAAAGEKDRLMFESGDTTRGTISCGQGVGMCREIKPCREIVADIMEEADKVVGRLAN
jgi:NADH:quinone reductase (non-electrogenic)